MERLNTIKRTLQQEKWFKKGAYIRKKIFGLVVAVYANYTIAAVVYGGQRFARFAATRTEPMHFTVQLAAKYRELGPE